MKVVCIKEHTGFTLNKTYETYMSVQNCLPVICIKNDNGFEMPYDFLFLQDYITTIENWRENQINKVIK